MIAISTRLSSLVLAEVGSKDRIGLLKATIILTCSWCNRCEGMRAQCHLVQRKPRLVCGHGQQPESDAFVSILCVKIEQ